MESRNRLLDEPYLYFALAFAVSIGGFWPSFFAKIPTTDVAHLIHGFSATAWMAIPMIQAWLVSQRKFQAHRYLGRTWLFLSPIVVISGLRMVQLMIVRYEQTTALRLLKFAFLDITALILFVTFLILALRSVAQGNIRNHSRYMACTALFALEPALERVFVFYVPGVAGFEQALYLALISMEIIVGILLIIDWKRHGRVFAHYVATLIFFFTIHILATPIAQSSWFRKFAIWFAAYGNH